MHDVARQVPPGEGGAEERVIRFPGAPVIAHPNRPLRSVPLFCLLEDVHGVGHGGRARSTHFRHPRHLVRALS